MLVILVALGAGCFPKRSGVGPFIRTAEVVGQELVTEKCSVRVSGGKLVATECRIERQRLPVVVECAAPAGPGATAPTVPPGPQ